MYEQKPLQELIAEQIKESDLRLPVFNQVALRLQQALNDDNLTVDEIEATVMEDPALASQILRVANGAFFKGLSQITTIRRAVVRLGAQQVANLAMVVSQQSTYASDNKSLSRYMQNLWRHAFATALGSKWVAERCGYIAQAEVAFLAGLLHDIGKLVILKVVEKINSGRIISVPLSDAVIAEALESSMHAEYGYQLMCNWNLPEQYCLVAHDHHREEFDPSHTLLAIVRLVNQACAKVGISLRNDANIVLAASPEAQILGMSEVQLAALEILLEESIETAKAA
ncbi:MAG: HDOD domain-containing protein [Gammaproteobacteria bacterium]